jgi:hypothetical protein
MLRSDRRTTSVTTLRDALLAATVGCVLAQAAQAESLPASVRACAQETDSLKRLICYDREVAKYSDQPSSGGGKTPPVAGPAAPTATAQPSPQPAPAAASPSEAPRHISAKIVSIENFPDEIVVHLDNGQVWQQVQEATASVSLRPGDTVTIDREMAAYWLSGSDGVAVKVRQKKK